MHCKQRRYDNDLAVGKHVVTVHTIQTHDIQTELNTFHPVHFPKTKTKLEEFEVGKSMSEGHRSIHHRLVNMYNISMVILHTADTNKLFY